ncbi:unnamed protein product [Pedinophyceae sp. YPF-701]|nr:unnamed protein product [Pedinophyceae sp. YPF-701]
MAAELLNEPATLRKINLKLAERLAARVADNKRLEERLKAAEGAKESFVDTAACISKLWAELDANLQAVCKRAGVEPAQAPPSDKGASPEDIFLERLLRGGSAADSDAARPRKRKRVIEVPTIDPTDLEVALRGRSGATLGMLSAVVQRIDDAARQRAEHAAQLSGDEALRSEVARLQAELQRATERAAASEAECARVESVAALFFEQFQRQEAECGEAQAEVAAMQERADAAIRDAERLKHELSALRATATAVEPPTPADAAPRPPTPPPATPAPTPGARPGTPGADSAAAAAPTDAEAAAQQRVAELEGELRELREAHDRRVAELQGALRAKEEEADRLGLEAAAAVEARAGEEGSAAAGGGLPGEFVAWLGKARGAAGALRFDAEQVAARAVALRQAWASWDEELEHRVREGCRALEGELKKEQERVLARQAGGGRAGAADGGLAAAAATEFHRGVIERLGAWATARGARVHAAIVGARDAAEALADREGRLRALTARLETVEAELHAERVRTEHLTNRIDAARTLADVATAMADDDRTAVELRARVAELEGQLAGGGDAKSKSAETPPDLTAVRAALTQAESDREALRAQLEAARGGNRELAESLETVESEVEEVGGVYEAALREKGELLRRVGELERQAQAAEDDRAVLLRRAVAAERKTQEAEAARSRAHSEWLERTRQLDRLSALADQLAAAAATADDYVARQQRAVAAEADRARDAVALEAAQRRATEAEVRAARAGDDAETLRRRARRLQERLRQAQSVSGGALGDSATKELEVLRDVCYCSLCKVNVRDQALARCGHTFCTDCIQKRIRLRDRKCPSCGIGFAVEDAKRIYLGLEGE